MQILAAAIVIVMSLLIIACVFHINVIVVGQNIFQVWITQFILLSYLFQLLSEYVLRGKFKSKRS